MTHTLSSHVVLGAAAALLAAAASGCSSPPPQGFSPLDDGGAPPLTSSGGSNDSGTPILGNDAAPPLGSSPDSGGSDPCGHDIKAVYRDFIPSADPGGHPDFERDDYVSEDDNGTPGLVKEDLGADDKPVYALPGGSRCTTGPMEFAQWYNDVPGVNMHLEGSLTLTESPPGSNTYVYQSSAFFPIDNQGFGNGPTLDDGTTPHNFSFTTEIHLEFTYAGGEVFTFEGDDDVWVFINKKLAVDLGGMHPKLDGTANLDAQAAQLGIVKGNKYAMDLFHAERHTLDSNFNITTSIKCFTPPVPK
ncbi:MAG TPA: fibro-slime domain-containing protein [Polyangiaceae bacterium]|jgi:fibro-slime domain-containing protein